jgi:hypothetical protein
MMTCAPPGPLTTSFVRNTSREKTGNWYAARYDAEKIGTAIRNGQVEFFEVVVPERRLTPLGSLDDLAGEP